jgi:hypothetical protein
MASWFSALLKITKTNKLKKKNKKSKAKKMSRAFKLIKYIFEEKYIKLLACLLASVCVYKHVLDDVCEFICV